MADKCSPSASDDRIEIMDAGEGPFGQEAPETVCLGGNSNAAASADSEIEPVLDMEYCSKDMCTCFDHPGGEERALDAITFVPNAIVSCPNPGSSGERGANTESQAMKPINRKIFLLKEYKEAIINLCYNKLDYSSRIDKLHIAWQCATILVGNSTAEACKNLLYWVLRHTLHLMLVGEWTTLSTEKRNEIRANILIALPKIQNSPNSANRCEYILQHFDNPWGDKRLLTVLHGDARLLTKNDLDYLTAERGCMIVLRLQKLCETKCDDVAFTLCSKALLALRSVGENHELRKSTSIGHIYFIFDIYLCLVHKYIGVNKFIEEVKRLGLYDALLLIRRNINMDAESSRLFKFRAKVAKLSANITIATIMVDCLTSTNQHFYCAILKEWLKMHQKVPVRKFRGIARKLFSSACSQKHLHLACHIIKEMKVPEWRELLLELYVRVITGDLNELELLKSEKSCSVEVIIENEVTLSHRYLQIADLLQIHHPYLTHECILTAFSLNPTPENYNIVKCVALTKQWEAVENPDSGNSDNIVSNSNQLESPSLLSKSGGTIRTTISTTTTVTISTSNSLVTTTSTKANQSRVICSTKNGESTPNSIEKVTGNSEDSNSSSTLNVLHSITGSNKILENPSYDALAAPNLILDSIETIDLPDHIRIDLSVLLSSPRVKFLSWLQSWPELESNCQRLLKPGGKLEIVRQGLAVANDHLQYLNLDYNQFRDLPESDGPGIEKGYEIFADSDEELSNVDSDYEVSDENPARRKKPGRKPKQHRLKSPSLEKQAHHMNLQREYKRNYNKSLQDPLGNTLCSTFAQALQHDPKLISPFNDFLLRHLSQESGENPPDSTNELDALFRIFYIQQLQAQLQLSSSYTAALQQQVTPSHQGNAIRFKQRQPTTANQKDARKRFSQVYTPSPIVPSIGQQHSLAPTSLARQQAAARGFPSHSSLPSQQSSLNPIQKTMPYDTQLTVTPSAQNNMPFTTSLNSRLNIAKRSYSQITTLEAGPSKIERSRPVDEPAKRKLDGNSASKGELLHPQTAGKSTSKLGSILRNPSDHSPSISQKQPSGISGNRVSVDESNQFQLNVKQSGNQVRSSSFAYVSAGMASTPLTTTTTALPSAPKLALSTLLSSGRWVQQPASELKLSNKGKPTFVSTQSITAGNTNSGIIYPPIDPKKVFYVERIIPASKRSLLGSSVEIKDISKLTMRTASSIEAAVVVSSGNPSVSGESSIQKDTWLTTQVNPSLNVTLPIVPISAPMASTSINTAYKSSTNQPTNISFDLLKATSNSSKPTKSNDLNLFTVRTTNVSEEAAAKTASESVIEQIEISDSCSSTDSALTTEDMLPVEPKRSKLTLDPVLSEKTACQKPCRGDNEPCKVGLTDCDNQGSTSVFVVSEAYSPVGDSQIHVRSAFDNSFQHHVSQTEDYLEPDELSHTYDEESKAFERNHGEGGEQEDYNENELDGEKALSETEESTDLHQISSENVIIDEQPKTPLEVNTPAGPAPEVLESEALHTPDADNIIMVAAVGIENPEDFYMAAPIHNSSVAAPKDDFLMAPARDNNSFMVAPEDDSCVAVPEHDSYVAVPEDDSYVAVLEGDSYVAVPEDKSCVAAPEDDSCVAVPEDGPFVNATENIAALEDNENGVVFPEEQDMRVPKENVNRVGFPKGQDSNTPPEDNDNETDFLEGQDSDTLPGDNDNEMDFLEGKDTDFEEDNKSIVEIVSIPYDAEKTLRNPLNGASEEAINDVECASISPNEPDSLMNSSQNVLDDDSSDIEDLQISDNPEDMENYSIPVLKIVQATTQEEIKSNADCTKLSTVLNSEPFSQASTAVFETNSQSAMPKLTCQPPYLADQFTKSTQMEKNVSLNVPPSDPNAADDTDTDTEIDDSDNDDINPNTCKRTDHRGQTDTDSDSSESRDLVVQVPRRTYSRISGAGDCSNLSPQNQSEQRSSSIQNNGSDQQQRRGAQHTTYMDHSDLRKTVVVASTHIHQESNDNISEGYLSDFECAAISTTVDANITNEASPSRSLCASILKDFASDSSDESELIVQIPTRTYSQLNSSGFTKRRSAIQQATNALISNKMNENIAGHLIDTQEPQQQREEEKYENSELDDSSSEDEDEMCIAHHFGCLTEANCGRGHTKFAASSSNDQNRAQGEQQKTIESKQPIAAKRGVFEFYINTYPSGKSCFSKSSIQSKETGSTSTAHRRKVRFDSELESNDPLSNHQTVLTKSAKKELNRTGSKLSRPNSGGSSSLCHTSRWVTEKFRRYQRSLKYTFKTTSADIKRMANAVVIVQPLTNETLLKHNQTIKIDGCLVQLPKIQLKRLRTCRSPVISFDCCCECAIKDVECQYGVQNDGLLCVPPTKKLKTGDPLYGDENSSFRSINVHSAMLFINPNERAIAELPPFVPFRLNSASVPKNVQLAPNDFLLVTPMTAIIEVQEKLNKTIYSKRIRLSSNRAMQIALSTMHGRSWLDVLQLPGKYGLDVITGNYRLGVKHLPHLSIRRLPHDLGLAPAILKGVSIPRASHFAVNDLAYDTRPRYPAEFNWTFCSVALSILGPFPSKTFVFPPLSGNQPPNIIGRFACILNINDFQRECTSEETTKINIGDISNNVEVYDSPVRCW